MRMSLVLALVPLALLGCAEKEGQVMSCARTWSCEGTVVLSDEDSFCTDPEDPDRPTQVGAYQSEFADSCDGVNAGCVDGSFATCEALCTPTGACPIDEAVNVRL